VLHWQAPADVQLSEPAPQSTHVAPAAPQLDEERNWHAPFESQQPLGQDVASHTH
jgi:hypothetical protein